MTAPKYARELVQQRNQYRQALAEQLRDGLAANRNIDLRESDGPRVVVAFADELVCPVWESLAASGIDHAHLFVAPTDFKSGRLSMVTVSDGLGNLSTLDYLLDSESTFGELIAGLREFGSNDLRVGLVRAPARIDESGFSFSFHFADLIDV